MSCNKSNPEQFHIPRDVWKGIRDIYNHLAFFLAKEDLPRQGNGRTEAEKQARIRAFSAGRTDLLRRKRSGEPLSPKEESLFEQLNYAEELEIIRGMLRAFWSLQKVNGNHKKTDVDWERVFDNRQSPLSQLEEFIDIYPKEIKSWPNYSTLERYLSTIHLPDSDTNV